MEVAEAAAEAGNPSTLAFEGQLASTTPWSEGRSTIPCRSGEGEPSWEEPARQAGTQESRPPAPSSQP